VEKLRADAGIRGLLKRRITHMIEGRLPGGLSLFYTGFTSTLIHALLYSVRLFGRTGVIGTGCGTCAGSAGVTARRRCGGSTCSALGRLFRTAHAGLGWVALSRRWRASVLSKRCSGDQGKGGSGSDCNNFLHSSLHGLMEGNGNREGMFLGDGPGACRLERRVPVPPGVPAS
jgi:hypothetical protein